MRRGIFDVVLEIAGTATAAAIVPALTFGWVKVDLGARPKRMPWNETRREPDGTWLIGQDLAAIIGILVWAGVAWTVVSLLR